MKITLNENVTKGYKLYGILLAFVALVYMWWKFYRPAYLYSEIPRASIKVNTEKTIFITSDLFLSFGMDSNLIRHRWDTFNFSSVKLQTLAKGLSPAYLRLMGTDGDRMTFDENGKSPPKLLPLNSVPPIITDFPFPPTKFNMTAMDWDLINKFCQIVGWRLLFGINGQTRIINKDGSNVWNSSNAEKLLEYTIKQGYNKNIDFEFGNEPESWQAEKKFIKVSPEQLAKEYKSFRHMLDTKFNGQFKSSLLAGPGNSWTRDKYFKDFVNEVDHGVVHAVTWHFYNGDHRAKYLSNYTEPGMFDKYTRCSKLIMDVWKSSNRKDVKIWQGEASSTVRPPGNGIAESYVATFMLLDKLGISAKLGMDLVIRQTFYGFWFAVVDHRLFPRPNYWMCVLFKRLVGKKVLNVEVEDTTLNNNPARLRTYAHCTSSRSGYPDGSIVVYAINLFPSKIKIEFPGPLKQSQIDQYLLTAPHNNLTSIEVELNGNVIKMEDDTRLPELKPLRVATSSELYLPGRSLAYYVLTGVKFNICL